MEKTIYISMIFFFCKLFFELMEMLDYMDEMILTFQYLTFHIENVWLEREARMLMNIWRMIEMFSLKLFGNS